VVQASIVNVIEPIFERDFAEHSYGFRPGRGCKQWTSENGLTLHPTKTKVIDSQETGFDFLGYTFQGLKHWPRKKSIDKLKDTIRVKTRRTSGKHMQCIIADVNRSLRGWFVYFQHSSYRPVFRDLDQWIRTRLRSILRKRTRRRGRARGADHQRWPNAYFAALGYYSLKDAHIAACQPSTR
jgi:RNA-directed DNA polymerase